MAQNTKYKSLEAIKASIRAGRKYAMESNPPEDPNEEKAPELDKENMVTPEVAVVVGEDKKNVNDVNSKEAISANTPLDQTLGADETDVKAEEKKPVETTEKEVSMPEIPEEQKAENVKEAGAKIKNALSDLIKKAKSTKVAKTAEASAPADNVAANIDLSSLTLSKIASLMLDTEQGRQLAVRTLEANKAEQIKQASLKELLIANEMFKQEESLRKTAAYKEAEEEFTKVASSHMSEMDKIAAAYEDSDPELARAIKLAYAQGATDAAAIQEGAQPMDPAAAPAPEQEQSEVLQVIDELVQSGQITPEQAQAIAQLAQEVAMQDQNPELSPEEEQMLLQAAVEQGLIPQEVIQQLMGGEAAAAAAPAEAAPAAPAPEANADAAAMQGAAPAEASKTAAEKVVKAAYILKKAAAEEGVVEDEEPSIEDVEAIIDELEASGQISEEEAEAIKEEVADAVSDEIVAAEEKSGEAPVAEEEVEVKVSPEAEEGEVSPEELSAFLAEQGVTPEELEAALADVEGEEDVIDDEESKEEDKEEAGE